LTGYHCSLCLQKVVNIVETELLTLLWFAKLRFDVIEYYSELHLEVIHPTISNYIGTGANMAVLALGFVKLLLLPTPQVNCWKNSDPKKSCGDEGAKP